MATGCPILTPVARGRYCVDYSWTHGKLQLRQWAVLPFVHSRFSPKVLAAFDHGRELCYNGLDRHL